MCQWTLTLLQDTDIHITIAARHIDMAKKHASGLALALCKSEATLVMWFIAATKGRIPLI